MKIKDDNLQQMKMQQTNTNFHRDTIAQRMREKDSRRKLVILQNKKDIEQAQSPITMHTPGALPKFYP